MQPVLALVRGCRCCRPGAANLGVERAELDVLEMHNLLVVFPFTISLTVGRWREGLAGGGLRGMCANFSVRPCHSPFIGPERHS